MTYLFAVQTEICRYLIGERSDYVHVTIHLYHDGKYMQTEDYAVIMNRFLADPPRFKLKFHYSSKNTTVEIVFVVSTMFIRVARLEHGVHTNTSIGTPIVL